MSSKNPQQTQKQQQPSNKKTYYKSDGKRVNDYIPNFISNQPWYYSSNPLNVDSNSRKRKSNDEMVKELTDSSNDRLKHQRLNPNNEIIPNNEPRKGKGIEDKFENIVVNDEDNNNGKGNDEENYKISFKKKLREWKRKGRCENCGGKHKRIDCLEKPHKLSFIFNNDKKKGLKNNEILVRNNNNNDWDTKRDRWHGYDIDKDYEDLVQGLKKKEEIVLKNYIEKHKVDDNNKIEVKAKDDMNGNNNDSNTDNNNDDNSKNDKTSDNGLKEKLNNGEMIMKAILDNNRLAQDPNDKIIGRSLDEKPRYLEVIKTGEELRYNPKSRVYKDLNEGYLNDRGQFIPYLTGEAAEFEKMKKFTRSIQSEQKSKWETDNSGNESVSNKNYATEVSPTTVMLKLKEKEEKDKLIREVKRNELLAKYGAIGLKEGEK